MKNTLAENMLRFAPKNLKANDIKTLKSLAEQGDVAQKPTSTSLQYIQTYNIGGQLKANTTWISAPFNGGTTYWLKPNLAVAQPIGQKGIRLVAGETSFNKAGSKMSPLGSIIFGTDIHFESTQNDMTGAASAQEAGNAVGNSAYVGKYCKILTGSTCQDQLNAISQLLGNIGVTQVTNPEVVKGVANLIMNLRQLLNIGYSDYDTNIKTLEYAAAKGQFLPNTLYLRA
jgi:hypothetical protein